MTTKPESLKFDNVIDGGNDFRKILCKVANAYGRKLETQLGILAKMLYVE